MRAWPYQRLAAGFAVVLGIGGAGYAVAFIALLRQGGAAAVVATSVFLMVGGILTVAVMVGLYELIKETERGVALFALFLGVAGSAGSALHGASDLAAVVNPPTGGCIAGCVSPTDPRGFATFGLIALALAAFSYVVLRGAMLPSGLGYLGLLAAALLVVIYIGRLVIYDPTNRFVLSIALLTGFVITPAWYVWLGRCLWGGRRE